MFDDDHEPHEMRQSPELSQDVKALINNGLDFLDLARKELDDAKAKPSVVSFWTAVEILLKVPLAHEHWSLVCSRKTTPNKKSYRDGDFQSITYEETCNLLRNVLEKPISDDTRAIFDKIRKHRNRLVHFYHPKFSEAEIKDILHEQADAWFRLHQLILKDWRAIFGEDLHNKLTTDESRMLHTSHYYIGAKFRSLGPRLKELRAEGRSIKKCLRCHQKAGIHSVFNEESDHSRHETDCLVCGYATEVYLEVVCPECSAKQRVEQDGESEFSCSNCKHTCSLFELIDECTLSPEDSLIMGGAISCSDCGGYETVCDFGGQYLCTLCFSLHESYGTCEYCSGNSTSMQDNSSLFGCAFCSGNQNIWDDD